jgi:hypothetical protein
MPLGDSIGGRNCDTQWSQIGIGFCYEEMHLTAVALVMNSVRCAGRTSIRP